jgi:hypothetical protein
MIKILLEGDRNSKKMNTTNPITSQLNYPIGQDHVATGVLLVLESNNSTN